MPIFAIDTKQHIIMAIAYVFLANGFEEIEATAPVDLMRRAGINVVTMSIYDEPKVTGAHNINILADSSFQPKEVKDADLLVCPGGMPGAAHLANNGLLCELLRRQHNDGKLVAAICAAPAVTLAPLGILQGKSATCYPGFEAALEGNGATPVKERVVRDGNVITANGPSSAILFGLALVEALCGKETADNVAKGLLC